MQYCDWFRNATNGNNDDSTRSLDEQVLTEALNRAAGVGRVEDAIGDRGAHHVVVARRAAPSTRFGGSSFHSHFHLLAPGGQLQSAASMGPIGMPRARARARTHPPAAPIRTPISPRSCTALSVYYYGRRQSTVPVLLCLDPNAPSARLLKGFTLQEDHATFLHRTACPLFPPHLDSPRRLTSTPSHSFSLSVNHDCSRTSLVLPPRILGVCRGQRTPAQVRGCCAFRRPGASPGRELRPRSSPRILGHAYAPLRPRLRLPDAVLRQRRIQ